MSGKHAHAKREPLTRPVGFKLPLDTKVGTESGDILPHSIDLSVD